MLKSIIVAIAMMTLFGAITPARAEVVTVRCPEGQGFHAIDMTNRTWIIQFEDGRRNGPFKAQITEKEISCTYPLGDSGDGSNVKSIINRYDLTLTVEVYSTATTPRFIRSRYRCQKVEGLPGRQL